MRFPSFIHAAPAGGCSLRFPEKKKFPIAPPYVRQRTETAGKQGHIRFASATLLKARRIQSD